MKAMEHPSMFFAHSERRSFHFLTLARTATVANRKKTLTLQNKEIVNHDKKQEKLYSKWEQKIF